jgi:hypothetical protein
MEEAGFSPANADFRADRPAAIWHPESMSGNNVPSRAEAGSDLPPCSRCRAGTAFVARISRTPQNPAFHIYRCPACSHLEWIEEAPRERP